MNTLHHVANTSQACHSIQTEDGGVQMGWGGVHTCAHAAGPAAAKERADQQHAPGQAARIDATMPGKSTALGATMPGASPCNTVMARPGRTHRSRAPAVSTGLVAGAHMRGWAYLDGCGVALVAEPEAPRR